MSLVASRDVFSPRPNITAQQQTAVSTTQSTPEDELPTARPCSFVHFEAARCGKRALSAGKISTIASQPTAWTPGWGGSLSVCRMDDASITWREPVDPPEGSPPPDIPGRRKDRKSAPNWMDLVLDLGPSERELLKPVPKDQRPK